MAIRVLIVDDHPVVRGGLQALLETLDGIEAVGQASDGASALREVALTRPDVVVTDLRMPGIDGVEATRSITARYPGTAVLVLTMFAEDSLVAEALAAGAQDYLLKGRVRRRSSGRSAPSPRVTRSSAGRSPISSSGRGRRSRPPRHS